MEVTSPASDGKGVRVMLLPHLDGMLDPAQKPIRLAQKLRLPRLHQPVTHQLVERHRGRMRLQERISARMQQLKAWVMNSISRIPP